MGEKTSHTPKTTIQIKHPMISTYYNVLTMWNLKAEILLYHLSEDSEFNVITTLYIYIHTLFTHIVILFFHLVGTVFQ